MNKIKIRWNLIGAAALIFIFSTCKKEIKKDDFELSSNPCRILKTSATVIGYTFKRPVGGYLMVGHSASNNIDINILVTDEFMQTIYSGTIGGSMDEQLEDVVMDENGDIYIVGATKSPDLRIDHHTTEINSQDAFLAKVDMNGQLKWIKGYCDTLSLWEGYLDDGFGSVKIINDKLYCSGWSNNFSSVSQSNPTSDMWLVTFDKDGNKLRQQIIVTPHLPLYPFYGIADTYFHAEKFSNNDLILHWGMRKFGTTEWNCDTTAMLIRYSPASESILWEKHFLKNSPENNIGWVTEGGDGNIIACDGDAASISKFDFATGNKISMQHTGLDVQNHDYFSEYKNIRRINDETYVLGVSTSELEIFSFGTGFAFDCNPWLLKLDKQGKVLFSKTYDIMNSTFTSGVENKNGQIAMIGFTSRINSSTNSIFTLSLDKNGDFIKPF